MSRYWAEAIGTFFIVFCGTGAIIINEETGGAIGHFGIAVVFGLIVMAMIYSFGEVSGAHFNPAVTLAFWSGRLFPGREAGIYCIVQCIGGIVASLVLKFLFPDNAGLGATAPSGAWVQSLILEGLLTGLLMLVILLVSHSKGPTQIFAGAVIGGVVLLEAMFAGPICGASMNPARSLGPALVSGNTNVFWIYIAGPVSGALVALFLWKRIFKT